MNTQVAHSTTSTLRTARLAAMALIAALAAAPLLAGPVAPPAGAVGPTMKTLAEIEPRTAINATNTPGDADSIYRITQPGSYYLTGNITGANGKRGIEISASNVTIDLCGFTLTGAAGSLIGICHESSSFDRAVVSNGTVSGWTGGGVQLNNTSRITGITSYGNTLFGIRAGLNAVINSCSASGNNGVGIEVDDRSIVQGCNSTANTTVGISLAPFCRAERCIASGNGGDGFTLSSLSLAAWCSGDSNGGNGFALSDQTTITDCSAGGNTGAGITCFWGATVSRCVAMVNTGPGIRVSTGSRVEGNNCRYNGNGAGLQAGILVSAGATRVVIQNNTCSANDYGIKVDGTLCLVKGNTVSANTTTNFEIVAGNRVASILTMATSPAISGSAGGTAITDPDANYAY